MFKTLYVLNFAIKLFLEEKLVALKIHISNIDTPDHRHIQKSTAFIELVLTLVDGKQLKILRMKMSGKMQGLFPVQDVAKDHDLPGEVLRFDVTNLENNFDKENWHVIMEKSMFRLFSIGTFRNQLSVQKLNLRCFTWL